MRAELALTPDHAARCVRVFEYLPAPALLPHLVALALLLPDRFVARNAPLDALARVREQLRVRCRLLFVRMPQRIEAADLEDSQDRVATLALARAIVASPDESSIPGAQNTPCLTGDVERERIDALLPELQDAPLGSAMPWLFAAELLGTTLVWRTALSDAPAGYRSQLHARLASLAEQSPEIFRRALVQGDEPGLGGALRDVCDALRGVHSLGGPA